MATQLFFEQPRARNEGQRRTDAHGARGITDLQTAFREGFRNPATLRTIIDRSNVSSHFPVTRRTQGRWDIQGRFWPESRSQCHRMAYPPSTQIVVPVTKSEAREAK